MSDKKLSLGFDRFLALEWADYALELFQSANNEKENYIHLKNYLSEMISGKETSRKTSNQLNRLWLNGQDDKQDLRLQVVEILSNSPTLETAIFHFGMAINISPIFMETCKKIGELNNVQENIFRQSVVDRVTETFANPTSVPRIVARVIQTLINWGLLVEYQKSLIMKEIQLTNPQAVCWFVKAMMKANLKKEISLIDMELIPEKLGINFKDLRIHIQSCDKLGIRRGPIGEEIIILK